MLRDKPLLQRIAIILADMYGLYCSLLLIAWVIIDERFFFTLAFISFMPVIFYLIPIVLLIALWTKSLRTILLTLIPCVAFAILYVPTFLPQEIVSPEGRTLSVLTYNIFTTNTDNQTTIDLLRELDADIVALQEVSTEAANLIEGQLSEVYPYQVRFTMEKTGEQQVFSSDLEIPVGTFSPFTGRMLLSKYPITHQELIPINSASLTMLTEIIVDDRTLTVNNMHFPLPLSPYIFFDSQKIEVQAQNILDRMPSEYTIFLGDFNSSEHANLHDQISATYTDVFRVTSTGLGNTFPNISEQALLALLRLDYIFVGEGLTPQFSEVIYQGSSDHYPVYAELVIE